jgi:hypothetical protein
MNIEPWVPKSPGSGKIINPIKPMTKFQENE